MIKRKLILIMIICLTVSNLSFSYAFWASTLSDNQNVSSSVVNVGLWDFENIQSIFTDFEDVSKGSYAAGEITSYEHVWLLDEALIGTLETDLKNDAKSVRLQTGYLEARFGVVNLRSISFYAGPFGSDNPETLSLELSDDQINWLSYDSISITSSFNEYFIVFGEDEIIALGFSREDSLFIRFASSSVERINIDDVAINYVYEEIIVTDSYHTGFEASEGFDVSTTYNNTTIKYVGNAGEQWGFYYGTPSKTGAISGSQSAQMRWYKTAPTNLGYMFTDFELLNLESISFLASSTNSLNVVVSISIDGGLTFIDEELFILSGTPTEYTYFVSTSYNNELFRVKFTIAFNTNPPNTSRLLIDDVILNVNSQ